MHYWPNSRPILFGAALSICWAIPATVQAAPLRAMNYLNWSGGSYTDDQSGKFSHCALSASYKSGITLAVSINRFWNWTLGFYNPSWHLQPGQQIPLNVSFDSREPYSGNANAINPNFVALPMANESKLITDFRASSRMNVFAAGQDFPFILTSTSKVMVAVSACVKAELDHEGGGPVPDLTAIQTTLTPAPRPRSLNPPMALAAPPQIDNGPEMTLLATQIASNLLLQAKLSNARLLSAAETPDSLKGFGVAWASDDGVGAVKVMDAPEGQTGQDVASQLIAAEASSCKGDFASGRSSELVDNSIVTKAFIGCRQSSGMKSARYLIYQGGPRHFVVFDTIGATSSTRQPSEAPPTETRLQTAALRAVSYETWK